MSRLTVLLFALLVALVACGDGKPTEEKTTVEKPVVAETKAAVCVWDKGSVRETPTKDGKWLNAMSLGEKVTWLGETVSDSTSGNTTTDYYKVKLSDGQEGWVSEWVVEIDAQPAVMTAETQVFKRPDLITGTKTKLDKMEFAAIIKTEGEWAQFVGSQKKKKGWIKAAGFSTDDVDIAVGLLATKALAEKDSSKMAEKINEILDNNAFQSSVFLNDLEKALLPRMELSE
jgi:hypothetical protein